MPIDDIIREKTDVGAIERQRQQAQERQRRAQGNVSRASLGPVIQLEKTDIQLWLDVAKVGLLVYIAMRV